MTVNVGDARELLAGLADASIDAVVTDPPYELGFMGKAWDGAGIAYSVELWRAVLRVMKPGAHLLAFGGTRTYHRMTCAIEDAGFEIRDALCWLYGQGFPKSLDVSKAIDSAAGSQREVIGIGRSGKNRNVMNAALHPESFGGDYAITTPATDAAKRWQGWGTALKPAHEPIVLARKPLIGTVAANAEQYGTGALNIDGSRIATSESDAQAMERCNTSGSGRYLDRRPTIEPTGERAVNTKPLDTSKGRWPANILLDEEAAKALDEQSGMLTSGHMRSGTPRSTRQGVALGVMPAATRLETHGDSGASRFFYVAKPSKAERNIGGARNIHPTVKPLKLMQYLVRLVTPPGGMVLDPFTGSGTTGMAAKSLGFQFLGFEQSAEYAEIARQRIAAAMAEPQQDELPVAQNHSMR